MQFEMSYFVFASLLLLSFVLAAYKSTARDLRGWSLLSSYVAFVLLYVTAVEQIAQDRETYYLWFRSSELMLDDPDSRDRLFSWALSMLPRDLPRTEFGIVFSTALSALIASFFIRLAHIRAIDSALVPLAVLALLSDRLFMDASLNSTRSTMAAIVFLLGLTTSNRLARTLLWGAAFGIHVWLSGLCILGYAASLVLRYRRWLMISILILATLIFMLRLGSGGVLTAPPEFFENFAIFMESESLRRGVATVSELTESLAGQMALGIIGPMGLALWIWSNPAKPTSSSPESNTSIRYSNVKRDLASFTTIMGALGISLFPDYLLAQRLFIVPLMCVPIFLSFSALRFLVAIKTVVILIVLEGQVH